MKKKIEENNEEKIEENNEEKIEENIEEKIEEIDDINFKQPEDTLKPPCSVKIRFGKKNILINVVLHKIPETKINLVPTDDYFYLDTLKYSKKFWLKFPYPREIKVNAEKCEASLEHGVLNTVFPITQVRDNFSGKLIRQKKRKNTSQSENEPPLKKQKTQPSREEEVNIQLQLVDEINKAETEKINNKLEKEQNKNKVLEEKKIKNKKKKEKKNENKETKIEDSESIQEQKEENHTKSEQKKKVTKHSKKETKIEDSESIQEQKEENHTNSEQKKESD